MADPAAKHDPEPPNKVVADFRRELQAAFARVAAVLEAGTARIERRLEESRMKEEEFGRRQDRMLDEAERNFKRLGL
jgi:hypothetical protein